MGWIAALGHYAMTQHAAYKTYSDWYRTGPYAPFIEQQESVGRSPVAMVKAHQPEGDFSDPALPELILIQIDSHVDQVETDFGAGLYKGSEGPGKLCLVPPNTATDILVHEAHKISVFAFPFENIRTNLDEVLPDFSGDFGRLHARAFRNATVLKLCQQLWAEAKNGDPLGALYADNISQMIVAELLRQSERIERGIDEIRALDDTKLALIEDYLESDLGSDAGLADLANLVGYSTYHFSRAFKAATGVPPHQYLIERRLQRAQDMLSSTTLNLVEIAYACGFSSQAHMTSTFSNHLGVTPGKYRRERLS